MVKKFFLTTCFLFFLFNCTHAQTDSILNRYKVYLLKTVEPEGDMKLLSASISPAGQWEDIDYKDAGKANWKPLKHLQRIRDMALVWANPNSPFYHQKTIWKAINKGLNHWVVKMYKNSNWWHNEIGVPQYIRDIVVLLKDELPPQTLSETMKVFAQHRVQYNGVGANLTWSADLGFHYAALTKDTLLMRKCLNLMLKEIKVSRGEGIQPDFSFHQHDKRLQLYHYGKAYLWENTRLAWQFMGTEFSFPKEKVSLLTDMVLNGWQWMARGIHTVPGTLDRSVSRVDALQNADIRKLIPYLMELNPEQADKFKALNAQQNNRAALTGYRYYPYSDFTAYHEKDFSFFLKTISTRTLASEAINSENQKGYLLNSGDAYLIKGGNEYFNLMPVWDWLHLPGVTAYKGATKINRKLFTGAVSDGKSGLSVMDYQMDGKQPGSSVTARKIWASHKGIIICLIADLKINKIQIPVYTTLDQSRWNGEVTVNKTGNTLVAGVHQLKKVKWIHHAGFVYVPLNPSSILLNLGQVSGSWSSINASLSAEQVHDQVFMPVLEHKTADPSSTGYVLALSKTPKDASKLARQGDWKVIRNDKDCQAVRFKDGTVMASFFTAGKVVLNAKDQIVVDQPCLVMVTGDKIYASNPVHSVINLRLQWQNKTTEIQLKGDGSTTQLK